MRTVAVIGGGIVGLAVARELTGRGVGVTVLEKESRWAAHQSGHNSNVAHAGLYYRPGSLKARLCVAGNRSITAYARDRGLPVDDCGKLVVATEPAELPALHRLAERAEASGVPARLITPQEAREYEPEVSCVAALRVASTAVLDFAAVTRAMATELAEAGAELRPATEVRAVHATPGGVELDTDAERVRADGLVNCAGLHADRIARAAGLAPSARIVPFRGEYYALRPERAHLVRGLIYPVPDPALPFLGVHLTRMPDGSVHAGPNAVLAGRREGYRWAQVSPRELADLAGYPGLWRLARAHALPTGLAELRRSLSTRRFAASLARLVPAIGRADIERCGAGVRAQAVLADGALAEDFLLDTAPRQVHVLNAPSPAATSALEIARHIADELAATA